MMMIISFSDNSFFAFYELCNIYFSLPEFQNLRAGIMLSFIPTFRCRRFDIFRLQFVSEWAPIFCDTTISIKTWGEWNQCGIQRLIVQQGIETHVTRGLTFLCQEKFRGSKFPDTGAKYAHTTIVLRCSLCIFQISEVGRVSHAT